MCLLTIRVSTLSSNEVNFGVGGKTPGFEVENWFSMPMIKYIITNSTKKRQHGKLNLGLGSLWTLNVRDDWYVQIYLATDYLNTCKSGTMM